MTSTGQGILGCNMFAYCNNNPVSYCDNGGKTPILAATIGGAVGGALWNVLVYLSSTNEVTPWGVVGALSVGAAMGALGGWAGVADAFTKGMLIVTAGLIAGAYTELSGGSRYWGFLSGALGTYWGTCLDDFGRQGFSLAALNSFYTVVTSALAELVATVGQSVQEHVMNGTTAQQHNSSYSTHSSGTRNSKTPGYGGSHYCQFANVY